MKTLLLFAGIVALAGAAAKNWTARAVLYSAETPPQVFPIVPTRSGGSLILPVNQPGSGTWLCCWRKIPPRCRN